MPGRALSCVASTSGSLLILSGLSGAGSGVRTATRSCCFSPTHSLTKCCGKRGGQTVRPPSNSRDPGGNNNRGRTFLVLKFLLPVRFLSGAGELLCGGLASGAWEGMASGSGAVGVSPSGTSLVGGSEGSIGEPGGKSEQVLMVRARRRCWPMCVRFLEKLFLFLEPLTLAGFNPGSSFTSRIGYKTNSRVFRTLYCQCHVTSSCSRASNKRNFLWCGLEEQTSSLSSCICISPLSPA